MTAVLSPTSGCAEWHARATRAMPGGVSSPVRALHHVGDAPLFIARAFGSRVVEVDGSTLIDLVGSWGAAIVGHAHPAVVDAVARTARDGLSFGATTRLEVQLAEEVIARVPGAEQVRFVCSGTEAVMSAVRLARAATRRAVVVRFEGCYHGHSDAMLSGAGSGVAQGAGDPGAVDACGVPDEVSHRTRILPYNDVAAVHELFSREGDAIACVIVEPVAANMGLVRAEAAFLQALREVTHAHGALLIFDEVITGFRVARGGAQELTGVRADLLTLGKIIGGGLPVGVYAGPARLMQLVAPAGPVYQAGTLAGNPVAMAAGLATLRLLDGTAYARLEQLGAHLETVLRTALAAAGPRASLQRVGSLLTLFFGLGEPPRDFRGAQAADALAFAAFFRRMRRAGVLLPPSALESWFLSLAHDDADIAAIGDAAARSARALPIRSRA